MRASIVTLNLAPTASPMVCTSVMISATRARASASPPILSKGAPVRAETGLNEQLPHSLIQISSRMRFFCGAFKPPAIINWDRVLTRAEASPEGSPKEKRLPSKWRTRPGSAISQAG